MMKVAKTADLTPHKPIHLGTLLEQSEYYVKLEETFNSLNKVPDQGCNIVIKNDMLCITTHHVTNILPVSFSLKVNEELNEFSFFIVPNLFEFSCKV